MHDIEIVYKFYLASFVPTLELIKTLKRALNENKASMELYHDAIGNFTEWYNNKYEKDIDSSYVENRIRIQEKRDRDNGDMQEAEIQELDTKNHIELSKIIRHEQPQ